MLAWLSVFSLLAFAQGTDEVIDLTAGMDSTCALHSVAPFVRCWGNTREVGSPPELSHPSRLALTWRHACALDDSKVRCWGWNQYGQTSVPPLKKPTAIAAGTTHSCAIDDGAVKCWGDTSTGATTVPPLKEPKLLAAGEHHTCVVDRDGVKCWGQWKWDIPTLHAVTELAVGEDGACALAEGSVRCWGRERLKQVPALTNPTKISVGDSFACALTAEGAKCWGDERNTSFRSPKLNHPAFLTSGSLHTCAMDAGKAKCWGNNGAGQLGIPGPKVNDSEIGARHTAALAELAESSGKKITERFPKAKVMDHCASENRNEVVLLLEPSPNPRAMNERIVALTPAGEISSLSEGLTYGRGGQYFLGKLHCLSGAELRAFIKEEALTILKPELVRGNTPSVCIDTDDVYNNWDCFTADRAGKYVLSARAARAD